MPHRNNYVPGSTVLIQATIKDNNGNNTNATSVTVTITNPHGTVAVNSQSMTNTATGVYQYNYVLPSTAIRGRWKAVVTATTSSLPEVRNSFFTVDRS